MKVEGEHERRQIPAVVNIASICIDVFVCIYVQYLEELGLMEQIKSFAGSSAGGMMAALLAIGYKADEVEQFLSDRIDEIFIGIVGQK